MTPHRLNLLRRGLLNVQDAMYLVHRAIPSTLSDKRWGLVTFNAFTAVELLVKGLTCLAGYTPRENHNVAAQVRRLTDLLKRLPSGPPTFLTASVGPAYLYSVWSDGRRVRLYRRVHDIYTQLGASRTLTTELHHPLTLDLTIHDGKVEVSSMSQVLISVVDSTSRGKVRARRHLVSPAASATVASLETIAKELRQHREGALYGTGDYSESDAIRAQASAVQAAALLEEFVPGFDYRSAV